MKPEEISKRARLIVRWFDVSVLGRVDVSVLRGVDVPVLRGVDVPVLFPLFFLSPVFNLRCILRDNTCKRRNTPFLFSSFVSAVINVCTLSKDNSSFHNRVLITCTVPPKVARTSKLLGPSPGYPRVASKPLVTRKPNPTSKWVVCTTVVLMRSSTTTTHCV